MEISVKNLCYKNIYNNFNLEILGNKVTLLTGKNSVGKTTFCDLLYGLYDNYEGEILLDNKNICYEDISYLKQENSMLFNINLLEDITYNLGNYDQNELYEMLKCFELDENILVKNYLEISKSEYKKICIISTFLKNSKIIVLDEPTIGLDQKSIQSLTRLIKRKKRKDNIIIIISNNSDFLLPIVDNIVILDNNTPTVINNKYDFFKDNELLDKVNMIIPNIIKFNSILLNEKNIKLHNQDNISDLLKEIYRNA